ncbi:MAG: DNA-directed DNA polymerase I [Thermoproteota archaeon]
MEARKGLLLVSVSYDGSSRRVLLKLYDPENQEMMIFPSNENHQPYLLTDLSIEELMNNPQLINHHGFERIEEVKKYDLLEDREKIFRKIIAKDPLSIGGSATSIREILGRVWEADIHYTWCYIYDTDKKPGLYYDIIDGKLVERRLETVLEDVVKPPESQYPEIRELIEILNQPIPFMKLSSLDIEVKPPGPNHVPDANKAEDSIISVAFKSNTGDDKVYVLDDFDGEEYDGTKKIIHVSSEVNLLREVFKELKKYPFLVTFNGDKFDLLYLYNRAGKLSLDEEVPLEKGRDYVDLVNGVHIDLYRVFFNKSIQNYAYGGAYKEATLDAIGKALIGKGKVTLTEDISLLKPRELAEYCFRDAEITFDLIANKDYLLLKLLVLFMRISRLPMEDIVRHGVSTWIKSMLLSLHRRNNYLIPRQEDILQLKSEKKSEAIIKGKKYRGAIVLEPKPGLYFNLVILDFASLYPSIIMNFNISYETVRCGHEECKSNTPMNSPHWICVKKRGIESSIIGALRELRVKYYQPLSKKAENPEKRAFYDVVQRAIKVFINASYGVMGADTFHFYAPSAAETVTWIGRGIFTELVETANSLGIEVVYGDTDSIFLRNPRSQEVEKLIELIREKYNIELNIDKVYRYGVFSQRKKNYLGVTEDGNVDIKGLVGKKSSTPKFVKQAFHDMISILSKVRNEKEFNTAVSSIKSMINEYVEKLVNKQLSLEELAFDVMLSKPLNDYEKSTPQHVKAAKQLERELGVKARAGDIISYVKVKNGVKPVKLARIEEIDLDKYLEVMKATFEQVLDPLGIEIEPPRRSLKLKDFM